MEVILQFSYLKEMEKKYAIKFFTVNGDERKLKRFIDEYFTFAQCPSHENILPQYHFDKVK